MLPGFLLALREGVEAALIIGILLSVLDKTGRPMLRKSVWAGTAAGLIISVLAAAGLMLVGASFEGKSEQIFEGITMLLAAGVLSWMVLWMKNNAREMASKVQAEAARSSARNAGGPLFLLAVSVVLREGVELALFLTSASFTAGETGVLVGSLLGLLTAVVLAWLLNRSLLRLNLRHLFNVTSILLIIFAAGLVAHGVHELNEVGWVPPVIEHVWDLNPVLDENSSLGAFLKTLVGYNGNPSLTEVFAYLLYAAGITTVLVLSSNKQQVGAGDQVA